LWTVALTTRWIVLEHWALAIFRDVSVAAGGSGASIAGMYFGQAYLDI
jgi:hypothetical protein